MSVARSAGRWLAHAGGWLYICVMALIIAWPGHILALPSAVGAVFGAGTPGVFTVEQPVHSKSELWRGTFRSDDGAMVLTGVIVDPGWGSFRQGQSVPAIRTPLPGGWWWVLGHEVHPRSGNTDWAFPAMVTLAWIGLAVWAGLRFRRRLRRAGLLRQRAPRAPPPRPACSCADPGRCEHA